MTKPVELYACVYAREFPAQAMLRLRPELAHKPCVVMEGEPPLQAVCSSNAKARRLGIAHGMTPVEIETFPSVVVLQRAPAEEAAARNALLECVGMFSPCIEEQSTGRAFVCAVDIAGTEKLFGPPLALASNLQTRIRALGVEASIAVSHGFHTATCMARGRASYKDVTLVEFGQEKTVLAALPVAVLGLAPEQAVTFDEWGIRTVGMLAALPERALISRMGQEGKRLRQLACGELPHLFLPIEPPFVLEERMELDAPVELLEPLLFVLGVVLEHLIMRATNRVLALASVTVTLFLAGGGSHRRTVRPAMPSCDRRLWLKLLHLDLEAHPPDAAILSLTLKAEPGSVSKVQLGLFSPQRPEPAHLDVLLARIRAIVGENGVGRAVLKDTHQPASFRMEPFTVHSGDPSTVEMKVPRSALRALRPPESICVTLEGKRPRSFFFRKKSYTVDHAYGPWLVSGDWWNPTLWGFQQWDLIVRADDGTVLYCLVQKLTKDHWEMAGLYD